MTQNPKTAPVKILRDKENDFTADMIAKRQGFVTVQTGAGQSHRCQHDCA